jgi:nucleoside-diphosphate-sugar epimerase
MPASFLILGGTGFIGRNLTLSLQQAYPSAFIQVVDKKHPMVAHMSEPFEAAFASSSVKFVQCDLSRPASMGKAFSSPDSETPHWDLVVNLASETSPGANEKTYQQRCVETAIHCASKAASLPSPPTLYVDMSTALIYQSNFKTPSDENSVQAPWSDEARWKKTAEEAVTALSLENLKRVVFRPSRVYGPGDTASLMPRAVCAATYVGTKEAMKFLWDGKLKLSKRPRLPRPTPAIYLTSSADTVHVSDVCSAIRYAFEHPDSFAGKVYNLSDAGDTDNELANGLLGEIFGISVGFVVRASAKRHLRRKRVTGVLEGARAKRARRRSERCCSSAAEAGRSRAGLGASEASKKKKALLPLLFFYGRSGQIWGWRGSEQEENAAVAALLRQKRANLGLGKQEENAAVAVLLRQKRADLGLSG